MGWRNRPVRRNAHQGSQSMAISWNRTGLLSVVIKVWLHQISSLSQVCGWVLSGMISPEEGIVENMKGRSTSHAGTKILA